MRNRFLWKCLYWILAIVAWSAWSLSVIAAPSLRADANQVRQVWGFAADVLVFSQQHAWLMIPISIGIFTAGKALYSRVGSPQKWQIIKSLLDQIQKHVFEEEIGSALHHHRVTLFKYRRWFLCREKWPWAGWLVSVERSGYATLRRRVRFRAPDDADLAEGVAGQTWVRNAILIVSSLDDIAGTDSDELVQEYARKTWMPAKWLSTARDRPRPRALCGIPVEVKGNVWGVIVLDSRSPTAIGGDAESQRVYKLMGRLLALLLERS